jgi:hypothetical protein
MEIVFYMLLTRPKCALGINHLARFDVPVAELLMITSPVGCDAVSVPRKSVKIAPICLHAIYYCHNHGIKRIPRKVLDHNWAQIFRSTDDRTILESKMAPKLTLG